MPVTNTDNLTEFEEISLDRMHAVILLDRYDSKYCLDRTELEDVLEEIKQDYYILEIEGSRIQQYKTIYYDTSGNHFYLEHHNGIANRHKLRKREYVGSDLVFLEIKHKNNKGKTSKDRLRLNDFQSNLSIDERNFMKQHTPLNGERIEPKFGSLFNRITLVNRNMKERCTIDTELQFESFGLPTKEMKNLVVIELKQEKNGQRSLLAEVLKARKIYPCSFSKYCIGRALNEPELKNNLFKEDILKINRHFGTADAQVVSENTEFYHRKYS